MEHSYSVTLSETPVGKVIVRQQGLYYHFSCRCDLPGDIVYRLMVICGAVRENLGILVPEKESFVINTKVPVKRIGEGNMRFILVSLREQHQSTFIPISPEEPFAYIARLKQSFLTIQNGQPGIQIEKMQEC